jgi:molybdopterin-guanine dinucleotide biosynthesis protein B
MHEVGEGHEASLADLLRRLSPCDLILVESFKSGALPKLEVFRQAAGKQPLHPDDPRIVALASDRPFPEAGIPAADLNDVEAVADLVCRHAQSLAAVLAALERPADDASGL